MDPSGSLCPTLLSAMRESSAPLNCGSIISITSSTALLLSKRDCREESLENRLMACRLGPVQLRSSANWRGPLDPRTGGAEGRADGDRRSQLGSSVFANAVLVHGTSPGWNPSHNK